MVKLKRRNSNFKGELIIENKNNLSNKYKPKGLDSSELIDQRYKKIPAWSNNKFKLKHSQFYSKSLLKQFTRYFNATTEYLEGIPISIIEQKYFVSIRIIKRIMRDLFDGISMEDLLRSLIGNKGKLGLELAVADLKIFFLENDRFPKTKEKGMITIRNSITPSYWGDKFIPIKGFIDNNWKEFGIENWDDLLRYTFGEEEIRKWKETNELKKFNKAIAELKKFKEEAKRLPKYDNKKLKWIASSVSRGIWKKFGINVWNDLMKHTFGEINLEHNVYEGIEGFNKAKKELLAYYDKHKKLPTTNDFELIVRSIYRGVWQEYNINSWNDILRKLFGKVNLNLQNDYTDEFSLARVKKELRSFEKSKGRLPKSNDDEMTSIASAVGRGMFKEQGIMTWNDLLYSTFGSINREINQYQGKEGLKKAVEELKDFKNNYDKEPATGEMEVIYRTAKRGEWDTFGIMAWNDLLDYAYKKSNREKNKYKGSEGLERAKQKLKKFKKKFKKIPTSVDKGISTIYNIIQKGEWKIYGIHTWNDLLRSVFGKIYYEKNKHLGKQGLEKAIQKCVDFKKTHNRLPKLRDKEMISISNAITRGMWREFGINTWNDLLNSVFGEINKDINRYSGKVGLENAIQVLKEYKRSIINYPHHRVKEFHQFILQSREVNGKNLV